MKLKVMPNLIVLISITCLAGAIAITFGNPTSGPGDKPGAPPLEQTETAQPAAGAATQAGPGAPQQQTAASAMNVSVVAVSAENYQAEVKGYGEAVAHYAISYTAEVSGRVASLADNFEVGQRVNQGDVLITLENTAYRQAVAEAESNLAQAELDLLEEQRTGEQARLEWQRSGLEGEPNSSLVLREPQLAAAEAVVENARYSLEKAEQDLAKTVITAPFDALIVERNVQPGSYVQSGTNVAELYSTDRVEIEIPLSVSQWQNLPKLSNADLAQQKNQWPVTLTDTEGKNSWQGYVIRVEQHVDTTSRQRSIVVAVENPFDQEVGLFPGTFVQAAISGRTLNDTWALPASAISQSGDIWYVDDHNQLKKVAANKLFEKAGTVYVAPIEGLSSAQVVKRPLTNYVVGMQVSAKVEG
ncbi:efflux RND transporter periplasmic adaptor subunit [Reinekea marinisedimentorum]|uniref:RND family efflux transporter MFP subunit n=1 Tax=Reinekea marinisedimentorum TaxID=230495 RepID=A0A4R3IA74_9GAMM|nr:efflux RND transporter periplasmic adaptor subunit [Reinekea marinisedimentorum]TCS43338.1 RND family efflux transporter MFP subunit [Reinekea marinisedimentorum]